MLFFQSNLIKENSDNAISYLRILDSTYLSGKLKYHQIDYSMFNTTKKLYSVVGLCCAYVTCNLVQETEIIH